MQMAVDGMVAVGGLRNRTLNGIGWNFFGQISQQSISFVIAVLLARILSPREFGLLAMATVIAGFAAIFVEMGFGAALVQKKDIRSEHFSSVFWLNVALGLALALVFVAIAPMIAKFFHEPSLFPLTVLLAVNFLLGSLTIVQKALLTKALDFRKLALADILAMVLSGIAAIGLALAGFGVWSLAVQSVLFFAISAALIWKWSRWRPQLLFRWVAVRQMGSFSLHYLGTTILNYWGRNLDNLLIGRFIGTQPLGVYRNAYSVMLSPLTNFSRAISRVLFPSLSLIQGEQQRVAGIFLRATRTIALVTFPLMIGLFVGAQPFVLTFFGPKWSGMIPLLRVFTVTGLIQSVGTFTGNIYLSQGRADLQFRVGLFVHANAVLGIIVGLRWGVRGVAVGYTIATIINSLPSLYYAGRLIDVTLWCFWRNLSDIFLCALLMGIAVWAGSLCVPGSWPPWLLLMIISGGGVLVYGSILYGTGIQAYRDTWVLIREQFGRRPGRRNIRERAG